MGRRAPKAKLFDVAIGDIRLPDLKRQLFDVVPAACDLRLVLMPLSMRTLGQLPTAHSYSVMEVLLTFPSCAI